MDRPALDGPPETAILPAMTSREIDFYREHARRAASILEYGAGGSTVIAAECNVPSLYSVDSDARWIARLAREPAIAKLVELGRAKLVHVDVGPVRRWGRPRSRLHAWKWPRYARRPWLDKDLRPDLVLIDGLFRIRCILETLRRVTPDTKIMLHDFSPQRHRHALPFVEPVEVVDRLALLVPRGDATSLRARATGLLYRYGKK